MRGSILGALLAVVCASGTAPVVVYAAGTVLATSTSTMAYQRSAQDKVAYLHDGSLLVGFYDGSKGVIDQVTNPSTAPAAHQVQTVIGGDQVTLYTLPGSASTDIWIQTGNELGGSPPLEKIQHGTYNGSTFAWDTLTTIPGTITAGRQDPSVTWTGKWLIATWWDDTMGGNSDNVFMNWTTDKTGQTGWLSTALQLTSTNQNSTQVAIRHSAKLAATVVVYSTRCNLFTRTLRDSAANPSVANWTAESQFDPGPDDCEGNFGGPQIAIDENTGKIHVFKAVTNSNGAAHPGINYWLGTPDAAPMVTGTVTWNARVGIDSTGTTATEPPDIAGAVDAAGTVYIFWITKVSSGALKYVTLVSPFTSASAATTMTITGTQPRYPHVPAQAPLMRGYVPLVYQSGTGSPFSLVLDTSIAAAGGPPAPANLTAAPVASTQISLGWSASTGATSYKVQRSPDGSTGWTQIGTSTTTSYNDTGLSPATKYFYRVLASNSFGDSGPSNVASATTPPAVPPPTNLTASPNSSTQISLSWTASAGATNYKIQRSPDGSTGWTQVGTSTTTSFSDSGLAISTTYFYRVVANNGVEDSVPSNVASATTMPPPPTNLTASPNSSTQISLSWTASTGATNYKIQRSPDGSTGWNQVGTSTTTTFADSGLAISTTYFYRVLANNGVEDSVPSNVASATTMLPPPTNLTASPVNSSQVSLSWTGSTGAANYKIQRSLNGSTGWIQVGSSSSSPTTFTDGSVSPSTTYFYRVIASNSRGDSAPSNVASATTPAAVPPPTGLVASPDSPGQISLSWTASAGATSYKIQRSPDGNTGWTQIGTSIPTSTSNSGLSASTKYFYRVLASNGTEDSVPSNVASATTYSNLASPTGLAANADTSSQISLSWTASSGAASYKIQRSPDGSTGWAQVGTSPTTTLTNTGLSPATTYFYRVLASDGGGDSVPSNAASATTPAAVPPPASLTASPDSSSQISLTWTASSGATSYKIQRSPDSTTGWTQVGTSIPTNFSNAGLSPSTKYFYRVLANNGIEDSAPSNVASATTGLASPTSLTANPGTSTQINLGWAASGGATGYKIQRSPDGSTGWAQVGTSLTTSFGDTGLSQTTTYFYRVLASDGSSDSAPSNVASATTPATPARLGASTSTVNPGGAVTANWSGIIGPTSGDWIGLYAVGASDSSGALSFRYTNGAASGSLAFNIGAVSPGMYELRLFANNTLSRLATSSSITVQVASLSASSSTVNPGGTVTVTWSGIISPTSGDWIGLYAVGASDSSGALSFQYTNGAANGSLPYNIGALSPGTYELRLFANNSLSRLATSNSITVQIASLSASPTPVNPGGTVTATWSGINTPTSGDWIGLYAVGASDSSGALSFRYTNGVASGSLAFNIGAVSPGVYELRLFANNTLSRLATSSSITVQVASLSASSSTVNPGGTVTVTWSGIISPTSGDWIGLYAVGASDSSGALSFHYTSGAASGSITFNIPTSVSPGTYELRLFGNNSLSRLATTNPITVP